jgi:HIV Tat-specific factor 1
VSTRPPPLIPTDLSQAPAAPVLARLNKKRKEPEDYTSSTLNADGTATGPVIKRGKKDAKPAAATGAPRRSKNTAVYVRGLPPDTSHDELAAAFRKYGVLEEDDDGEPKVKMYARDDGAFSGDALVVYFKEESVAHAILFLDETELRLGQADSRMSVAQADFSNKQEGGGPAGANGDKPRKTIDKKKATRRLTKLQKYAAPASPLHVPC